MRFIKHDTNSLNDVRIQKLMSIYGYEGYGLLWAILEILGKHNNGYSETSIKYKLGIKRRLNRCWLYLEKVGLIKSNNGQLSSSLLEGNYNTKRLCYTSPATWKLLVAEVFRRDGYKCTYCSSTLLLECDHIIPFSKGGNENLDNLTTACRSCNRKKKDHFVDHFLSQLKPKN